MSYLSRWKKAKDEAKKAGVDVSAFREEFGKTLDKTDEDMVSFAESKNALVKQLEKVADAAGGYRDICKDLDKNTNIKDQEDAINEMDKILADIEQDFSIQAVLRAR